MPQEAALRHRELAALSAFASGGAPAPATTDDGNHWISGYCWLYCGQQWTRVLWIGPVKVAGTQAPMYACGPCIEELHRRVWQSIHRNDRPRAG